MTQTDDSTSLQSPAALIDSAQSHPRNRNITQQVQSRYDAQITNLSPVQIYPSYRNKNKDKYEHDFFLIDKQNCFTTNTTVFFRRIMNLLPGCTVTLVHTGKYHRMLQSLNGIMREQTV
jgi:hypothetical protein